MSRNLGQTALSGRRRACDPMRDYDRLPPPLRRWLAGAALPWSVASCRRIWQDGRARGQGMAEVLERLTCAERQCLMRAGQPGTDTARIQPIPRPPAPRNHSSG